MAQGTDRAAIRDEPPAYWLADTGTLALVSHDLATMNTARLRDTFNVACDRYAEELASGVVPDLLDVFEAAVKDTAPEPERGTDIAG
jgi:hypothetical protein